MGSNLIIGIVVAIIVAAAIVYFVGYFVRKKTLARLDELEQRKEQLFDLPVIEEVDEVKKMHLVGQSQNTFREWNQKWTDLSTTAFADLESQILEVESLNETFRFMKAKQAVEEAEVALLNMEEDVAEIRNGLKELRESEERNSLQVQNALDKYQELKKRMREESDTFGPAYSELQKQLKSIEIEFTQFVTLNTSGDPVEAREVLQTAENHTYTLEDVMNRLPVLYEDLNKTFPDQLKEIKEGYQKLIDDHFVFPENNFLAEVSRVRERIENSMRDLAKTEVNLVEPANSDTANDIDALYSIMEREIEAKKYVLKNREVIADYVAFATKNNRQLLIEIDHTAQSYTLNHNELGRVRGFQTEVDELVRRNTDMMEKMDGHKIPYSEVQEFYKYAYKILDDIQNQQVEIDEELRELRRGEKVAQEKVENFEFQLRNLKRFVEKQRLPGLPNDYLEFFFMVTDHVEGLNRALNKIRINMEDINRYVDTCQDDLDKLDKETHDLVDAAALTEQMMQYANRYRHSHPDIKASIDRSLDLFTNTYQYQEALDEIGTALERVEPGAFARIENFYFNHRELV
ncbi:septation ring formation regulator EzrA [Enterococcus cecorum]|uniref:Septation ring formation regulator EzrA n=2 Tax=Enterococcus cecorum TaxID=44008 RepID=S1RIA2_9ENTE|nr:septation ring formation regulator EzrA [Enterococcus cecorum]EOX17640.1 septation ring formation regulator EzrA [Enterococcus cecorum DSM 20682 = ATCC 43198]ESK62370.1 septation ring formation regulator EzrA [Enterococcus cecorum DSM 20682 = ATCC 43198]KLN92863.1 septation ring formation regulator EzrA [Enterococcus cecorum]KLN94217.1 septation ring formation regulator EzrA [Enterococcus cecorum]KLO64960.1 septation ring formation regulator EzrA [Enterococcus cecorum]